MKWIPTDKAKVVFNQQYLIKTKDSKPQTGYLHSVTESGPIFKNEDGDSIGYATYIAIITEPK